MIWLSLDPAAAGRNRLQGKCLSVMTGTGLSLPFFTRSRYNVDLERVCVYSITMSTLIKNQVQPTRVMCIVPPTGLFVREDRCQTPIKKLKTIALRPPIDLLYAAGAAEAAGAEVLFRDYSAEDANWADFRRDTIRFAPHLLIISATTLSLAGDLHAAEIAKEINPALTTAAMGAPLQTLDATVMRDFPSLDIAIGGGYEDVVRELARGTPCHTVSGITWRDAQGTVQRTGDIVHPTKLDDLPFPARHLARNELYRRPDNHQTQTTIVTNRGCPFSCSYCLANQVAGNRNVYRSVDNVMQEIRLCVEQLGITNFLFRSELFTQNKRWVIELCRAIIESGLQISWACNSRTDTVSLEVLQWMKRAGCWVIAYGVESGDQATLDRIGKHARVDAAFEAVRLTREAGIRSSVYLLIGLPWDTSESIRAQSCFARKLDPDYLEVFYPYPFPGTPLRSEAIALGLLREGELPQVAYSDPALPTLHLSKKELARHRSRILRSFYLRPKVISRTFGRIRSLREAQSYLRAGFAQLFTPASSSTHA